MISTKEMDCRHCGNVFIREHGNQRYCSDYCKQQGRSLTKLIYDRPEIADGRDELQRELICITCNKPFLAYHNSAKYCIICRKLARKKSAKKYYDSKKVNIAKSKRKEKIFITCKICNKKFERYRVGNTYCSDECRKEVRKLYYLQSKLKRYNKLKERMGAKNN